jgi:hypothetical protein
MEQAKAGESTDHPHQKSAWFCHGDVIPEGTEIKDKIRGVEGVDFWSEAKGHGWIVCTGIGNPRVTGTKGSIKTNNSWRTWEGVPILDETRHLFFYDLGQARLLVLAIDLHAKFCVITFGDTKEGAMGVRVNDAIRTDRGGTIQNADGKRNERDCWGRASAWCDYSGNVQGKAVGLTLMSDPGNPHASCWHSRGYGLMAANPFGRARSLFPAVRGRTDLVHLAKGEHLKLRYGILLHAGNVDTGRVAEHYQQFVNLEAEENSREKDQ